ncbi:type IV toxin-antitoxin system AbiEi family antitoxin domain-containing protein [Nocardioides sp.]|uniref:type IV toxin-antitoxin system AbiEi family antitoxin domain-containing protein n=1 Tax=Nocardioides sp. TaxID=35761 RepID=UPI00273750D9|nr:type IV toxin-antitoxin system AbiEi family antitoxin domain-containing protein [Nocardioides sp.]MDP3891593.1 type IV toxin-antitoxin system AbiEi family antitoxin domain-containing protein [Nocardioides sp.]
MDHVAVGRLLRSQAGVVARRQVLECGGTDNDIERLVRRREWARVHTGVYVDHTGPLSWEQRAWAAVLAHWPAALAGAAALRAHDLSPWRARVRDHRGSAGGPAAALAPVAGPPADARHPR